MYLTANKNEFYFTIMRMPMYSRMHVQKGYVVNDLIDI